MATIKVRLNPRASSNRLCCDGESIRAWVTAPPVENAANEALCELIAKRLDLPRGKVEIVRGEKSREKSIEVHGVSVEEVKKILQKKAD